MSKLEIVFTKSKKKFPLFSWLIQLYTRKNYSHIARKANILGQEMYYQADNSMVNYENKKYFNMKHEIVKTYVIDIPKEIARNISILCLKNAGTPYGFMQNIGILYFDIMRLFSIKVSNPWRYGKNCSELIYEAVIVPLWGDQGLDPDRVKPHHIEKILIEKKYKAK